ncbi:MAG: type I pantothenate kinase [Gammaproteobacteria bacterium]|nr:type I pantothenate kinase [Gammaproteobacteria bacterium]
MVNHTPFLEFSRANWRQFRQDTPLTLTESELARLRGHNESISLVEVEEVYLPIARLLNLYVEETQELYRVTSRFLGTSVARVPYIIGVAGSVAVGKSTISRLLKSLLSRWPAHREVDIVTTDGFLFSNNELARRGLADRKGFPESYDVQKLIELLSDIKGGKTDLQIPIYSHEYYDIIPDQFETIHSPDIVIVEGLNVLQVGGSNPRVSSRVYVSDYFDFSIYVDADPQVIEAWFVERFMSFRSQAYDNNKLFMNQFSRMSDAEAQEFAHTIWVSINAKNLFENVLPYKNRANLILHKGHDHVVEKILLRKL